MVRCNALHCPQPDLVLSWPSTALAPCPLPAPLNPPKVRLRPDAVDVERSDLVTTPEHRPYVLQQGTQGDNAAPRPRVGPARRVPLDCVRQAHERAQPSCPF